METEELIKLVDGIYKNILDKFNPGARQMINAGKAYLKALHGAAAASRMYVDAINKLARQAQQGTWGGSSDIGAALMKIVDVYKEIQDQQMNILKAFYVDLLVPLETNLEKDTKVVQSEQKRFLQQHKQRSETYSKAAAMMKKQRKKSRGSTKTGLAMDKELKNMQILEEEKTKLDAFCEQSLKNAMTQERRRYGFVLERQCSLSKHYLSYYSQGVEAYSKNIEKWSDVAKTREFLPESVENIFSNRLRQITIWQDEDLYSNPRSPNLEDDRMSINSQLRKTKSMDASCLDIRSVTDEGSPVSTLNRAKSEYNLNTSSHSLAQENTPTRRPKSMAVPPPPSWDTQLARALYAYLSNGENQLSFHEGDLIALVGERNKGWQFGENLRTQTSGWFPLAYTEILDDPTLSPSYRGDTSGSSQHGNTPVTPTTSNHLTTSAASGNNTLEKPSTRMFGDTLHLNRSSNNAKQIRRAIGSNNIPPPALPAPVPSPSLPYVKSSITQSQSTNFNKSMNMDSSTFQSPYSTTGIKSSGSSYNFSTHPVTSRSDRPTTAVPIPLHMQNKGGPVGNVSLHSSNDSGFSNDPPPQPEVDYSDDESMQAQTKMASRRRILKQLNGDDNNNTMSSPKKPHPIKQSRSHGNLVENKFYMSDDPETLEKERKRLVKRTKSFWKFGKNSSDNEILEGMALWKHRDLVDIDSDKLMKTKTIISSHERTRRPSRDKSEDSDRTINNNQNDNGNETMDKVDKSSNKSVSKEVKRSKSFSEKQRLSLVPKKQSIEDKNDFDENIYQKNKSHVVDYDDHFYDDEGDGLMLKTVNRKNILQQYTNDSSGTDSETESDMTSDDPYDCIVVEDQNVQKNENHFPNVAELGKKLEKLSKTSKYSPNKDSGTNNLIQEKNRLNTRLDRNLTKRPSSTERNEINQYHDKRNINNFKTFGIEIQNNENGEKERIVNDGYYSRTPDKRHKEKISPDKRRFYPDEKNKSKSEGRRNRPSYESIDSDGEQRDDDKRGHDKRNKMRYYDTPNDELSNELESRQTLPRTKLTKTNSNNSSQSKYENDIGLMDYGETLQRRLKNPEYNSKYDEKSPHNGNMYGPWYDLWGLDSTGPRK